MPVNGQPFIKQLTVIELSDTVSSYPEFAELMHQAQNEMKNANPDLSKILKIINTTWIDIYGGGTVLFKEKGEAKYISPSQLKSQTIYGGFRGDTIFQDTWM
jgi:hypothetical protein